jgi:hypothetical protein
MSEQPARQSGTLLLVAVGVVVLGGLGLGRRLLRGESDAAKNEKILAHLIPPPGARVVLKKSETAYESTSEITERKIGYSTDLEYDVPKGTSPRAIAEHYAKQLRGWKRHEEVIPCEEIDAGDVPNPCADLIIDEFTQGHARVSLNLDSFDGPAPWGYELTILQR